MLLQPHKPAEKYPQDVLNIFHNYDTEEELIEAYRAFARKNGTSEYINLQFQKRKSELDILEWRKSNPT